MITKPLDTLVARLNAGDTAAADTYRAYEPYLRMVVRRQLSPELRAKFDSLDVVQSVWVHLLRGSRRNGWRFADANHLRAFLTRLTRNRIVDQMRRHRRAVGVERPLDDGALATSREPAPAAVAEADELWMQLVDLCPPAHHELLRLRREGLPLAEVAARTGLHEGSVRRILYALARRLARREVDVA